MIKTISQNFIKNDVLKSSTTMFIGMMIVNFTNYLFNVILSRILTPERFGFDSYGQFFALNSFMYYFAIPVTALIFITSKLVAEWYAQKEYSKIKVFVLRSYKYITILAILLTILGIALAPFIQNFLKISTVSSVIAMNIAISTSILFPIVLGTLSGLHKFVWYSAAMIIGNSLRLILGLIWAMSFGALGAISGNIMVGIGTTIVGFLGLYLFLRDTKYDKSIKINFPWKLFAVTTLSMLAFGSFLSTDVILVKHFLSDRLFENTNLSVPNVYASISLFGRIIYFATFSFATVLIPLVSHAKEKKKNLNKILFQILGITLIILIPLISTFFLFPEFLVKVAFGELYLVAADYIGIYGVTIGIFAISAVLNNFFISLGHKIQAIIPITFAILQIILAFFFNESINSFIYSLLFVNIFTLIGLIGYFFYIKSSKKF